jgi:3-dehydroquinate synthase
MTNEKELVTVGVRTPGRSYEVVIGEGILGETGRLIRDRSPLAGRGCLLLADEIVARHYEGVVRKSLEGAGHRVCTHLIPAGESSKSLERVGEVVDAAISGGLDRSSFIVALGGGVTGDLGGFAAAIYNRGIPFVQIPTTIVAQVDSAVGGKTGVNAPGGKNLIGAFHQPSLVIADPLTLQTLPDREFQEGFAEVVKHAVIRDAAMLDEIQPGRRDGLVPLIARNVAIKAAIVEADEKECSGLRALLNFGHTVGHAIENAAGYGTFFHGEAISLGMTAALRLSRHKAGLSRAEEERVLQLLQELSLPVQWRNLPDPEALIAAMGKDKKFSGGKIHFVLTPRLGEAFLSSDVTGDDIRGVLHELMSGSS